MSRIPLGNVSTQPFELAPDDVQEDMRRRFLSDLRESVKRHGSVTTDGQRTNEQLCFRVTAFSNVPFPLDAVSSQLKRKWPKLSISFSDGQLQCMLPCVRRGAGPNHVLYELTYLFGYLGLCLASGAGLWLTRRCDCIL